MKKIKILILTLLASTTYAQDFEEYASLDGVYYGTSLWVEKENSIIQDVVVLGYSDGYDQFGRTYSYDYFGYDTTQQSVTALGMANADTLDANEDGLMDFISTGIDSTNSTVVNLYTQNLNGTFDVSLLPMGGVSNGKIKCGDLNHDGYDDFVIMGMGTGSTYIAKLYLGDGLGEFTESIVPFFPNTFGNLVFFDANNNGFTDVLITGFSQAAAPKTMLYTNDGTGVFTEKPNSGIVDAYFTGLSAGDYNNDGKTDVLLNGMNSTFTAQTSIYENDGAGNFTESSTNFEQLYFGSANFVDYNNDGQLDVFITGTDMNAGKFSTLYTNSNGVYTQASLLNGQFESVYISSSFWADFDNDGDLDLIYNGFNDNAAAITKIYRNNHIQLCIPNFTDNSDNDEITNVRIREINNDSPDSLGTPTYENFITVSTPIHRGEPHTITVTGYSKDYPSDVTVYIDLNQNSDLTDSNEEFYIGRMPAGNSLDSISGEIFIPSTVNLGFIKMRIIKSTNEDALGNPQEPSIISSPCDQNLTSGQTEDYTLLIKEPPYCPLPTDLTYNINTDFTIEVNWTEPVDMSTFSEYHWILMTAGEDPLVDNEIQSGVTNNGFDFTILSGVPGGQYDFYISTNCGTDLTNMVMITLDISYLDVNEEKFNTIIYPNPATNQINIKSKIPITLVEIYNMNGKLVLQDILEINQEQINVTNLKKGSYLLKLNNNGSFISKKLFIQ